MLEKYTFESAFVRRIPDPNFHKTRNMETFAFLMRCKDVPPDIGDEPNARTPNIKKLTYRRVAESLLGHDTDPGTFHLKNKGITIIAESVKPQKGTSKDEYVVEMDTSAHGIVDGGHTYALIQENKDNIPDDQYVRIDVRIGVPLDWIPMISGGLNTAVQVQSMSLENLGSSFNWVKETLGSRKQKIAWDENEAGKYIDARDLTAIMCLLNPLVFPNDGPLHPTISYTSKEKTLERFSNEDTKASFKRMEPILLEILELYDYIAYTARDVWNDGSQPAKGKSMKIIDAKKRGKFDFPFIDKESECRLAKAALYPILGSFRWFVQRNEISRTGDLEWITDFSEVKGFWKTNGREMLVTTNETLRDLGYRLTSLGKSNNLWSTLHSKTGMQLYTQGLMK